MVKFKAIYLQKNPNTHCFISSVANLFNLGSILDDYEVMEHTNPIEERKLTEEISAKFIDIELTLLGIMNSYIPVDTQEWYKLVNLFQHANCVEDGRYMPMFVGIDGNHSNMIHCVLAFKELGKDVIHVIDSNDNKFTGKYTTEEFYSRLKIYSISLLVDSKNCAFQSFSISLLKHLTYGE